MFVPFVLNETPHVGRISHLNFFFFFSFFIKTKRSQIGHVINPSGRYQECQKVIKMLINANIEIRRWVIRYLILWEKNTSHKLSHMMSSVGPEKNKFQSFHLMNSRVHLLCFYDFFHKTPVPCFSYLTSSELGMWSHLLPTQSHKSQAAVYGGDVIWRRMFVS